MANVSDKYLRDLLRDIVSFRANGHCEFPDCKNTECDPHHWFAKKTNTAIKYDYDACINLCTGHHTGNLLSAHLSPMLFRQAILRAGVRSEEWAHEVHRKASQIITVDEQTFRQEWKEKLLAELKRLGVRGWRV